jgi:hypothetical protein
VQAGVASATAAVFAPARARRASRCVISEQKIVVGPADITGVDSTGASDAAVHAWPALLGQVHRVPGGAGLAGVFIGTNRAIADASQTGFETVGEIAIHANNTAIVLAHFTICRMACASQTNSGFQIKPIVASSARVIGTSLTARISTGRA